MWGVGLAKTPGIIALNYLQRHLEMSCEINITILWTGLGDKRGLQRPRAS